jgi:hypothetical protein
MGGYAMAVSKQQIEKEETNLSAMLAVGEKLVAFQIDGVASYGEAAEALFTVEAVAHDWVVVRDGDGKPHFASVASWNPAYRHQISTMVARWFTGPGIR